VTLFEARNRLGGALASWAELPGRQTYSQAVTWWAQELLRLKVDIRLNTTATAEAVLDLSPDAVIVATGAHYSIGGRSITRDADISGYDRPFVYRPEDILLHGKRPAGRVILLDGEGLHTSTGIAELLAGNGAEVLYVTAGFSPLSPRLVDNFEARSILERMKKVGVRFMPTMWVSSIEDKTVELYDVHTGSPSRLEGVDAVVLSTGRIPNDALARDLEGRIAQLFTIGDALAARPLATASYEGQKFARLIGEPGAPRRVYEAYFRADEPNVNPLPAG
jgi:pyruvate/2-oxoglutarate dehydrogenase complex dihydrolipoamide dehydrogenase (E3) component